MMINKRLIGTVPESRKYVAGNVALQYSRVDTTQAELGMMTTLL